MPRVSHDEPVPFPSLIVSAVALAIAVRPAWRGGLEFALIGLMVNIILCLGSLQVLFILCCLRLHAIF